MSLEKLTTENRNEASENIHRMSTLDMVKVMNNEDKKVAAAVEEVLPDIARAIDLATEKFQSGGRLIYIGAGTSGRMGTLDAIELTPTYNVSSERAFGLLAGGQRAMYVAVEGAEDSKELAITDLKSHHLTNKDIVISIAASGRTPYAISAIEYANKCGALSIAVTCNKESEMHKIATVAIAPVVGPEVITGSTRMKAGTAQKMVLNMISTGIMVRTGKVYKNLMVNVQATNDKLKQRASTIVQQATNKDLETIQEVLVEVNMSVPEAIVMLQKNLSAEDAKRLLEKNDYNISLVLDNE